MKNDCVLVIGGGTAGWLTALYAKKIYKEKNIVLLEDKKTGILGAGEGSTPQLIDFLRFLEIDIFDLILKTNSTIKNGIKFYGFSNTEDSYFHGFDPISYNISISEYYCNSSELYYDNPDVGILHLYCSRNNINMDKFNFMKIISDENRIPINISHEEKSVYEIGPYGLHFDANSIAKYLSSVGVNRGINNIDCRVKDIRFNNDGYIEEVSTDTGEIFNPEFVFDCTGFYRIIGNKNKSEYVSLENSLPMNSALSFFMEKKDEKMYTSAIAMENGWTWQIPLQNRTGCGYVYNSSLINEDQVKKEIYKKFGNVKIGKYFNFVPGYFKTPLKNNYLMVGLSYGFLEPMEASSIWQLSRMLQRFFSLPNNLNLSQEVKNVFNNECEKEMLEIADFIYIHYVTKKENSYFWKNFTKEYDPPTDFSKKIIRKSKFMIPSTKSFDSNRMYFSSYYQIMHGNNFFSDEILEEYYDKINIGIVKNKIDQLKINIDDNKKECMRFEDFIISISGGNDAKI